MFYDVKVEGLLSVFCFGLRAFWWLKPSGFQPLIDGVAVAIPFRLVRSAPLPEAVTPLIRRLVLLRSHHDDPVAASFTRCLAPRGPTRPIGLNVFPLISLYEIQKCSISSTKLGGNASRASMPR